MKKNICATIFLTFATSSFTRINGQDIDSACRALALSSIYSYFLDSSHLYNGNDTSLVKLIKHLDIYVYSTGDALNHYKLIEFEDRRTRFQEHVHFSKSAFLGQDCKIIIPETIELLNNLRRDEKKIKAKDLALLYIYFNSKGKVQLWNKNQYNSLIKRSPILSKLYNYSKYEIIQTKDWNRRCSDLIYSKDSIVSITVGLSRDEFDYIQKLASVKEKQQLWTIKKQITFIFQRDGDLSRIEIKYFLPIRSKEKKQKVKFYNNIEDLIKNESNQ